MKDDTYRFRNTVFRTPEPEKRKLLGKEFLGNNREEPDVLSR
jgi:hypothetical protein